MKNFGCYSNGHYTMTKYKSIKGIGPEIRCGNQEWIIHLHPEQRECQALIQIIKLTISTLFLRHPMEPISPSLRHFGPISKGSFGIPRGQIHCTLFEGDLVSFLMDEIRWIRITHRPKKINIWSNSWWNQDFVPHFLEIG